MERCVVCIHRGSGSGTGSASVQQAPNDERASTIGNLTSTNFRCSEPRNKAEPPETGMVLSSHRAEKQAGRIDRRRGRAADRFRPLGFGMGRLKAAFPIPSETIGQLERDAAV